MGGNESKINVENGKIQISFFVGSAIAAKYTSEGEGLAGEGWSFIFDIIGSICTDFSGALFFFFFFLFFVRNDTPYIPHVSFRTVRIYLPDLHDT